MYRSFLLLALTLGATPAAAERPYFNGPQTKMLEDGKVIVRRLEPTGGTGVAARAVGLVDAAPTVVWPVIRDCQHFSKFMPRTTSSKLIERTGNVAVCEVVVDMPFPFDDLTSVVKSTETEKAGSFARTWALVSGTYNRNQGTWEVHPWKGGRSLLVYQLDIDPKISIPDAIIRKAQTGSLPDVFEAVRKRSKQTGG
jgi:ribosome-associated toxin RatA of RatAB toxin-antitoxin module